VSPAYARQCLAVCCLAAALLLPCFPASAQTGRPAPRAGYAFPAGGQQGETFNILVGGQYLQGVTEVHVTGTGVGAAIVRHFRAIRNLQAEQRRELMRQLNAALSRQLDRMPPESPLARQLRNQLATRGKGPAPAAGPLEAGDGGLPPHPLFENIADKSLKELLHLYLEIANFRRRQPNAQIGEMVLVAVAVAQDAEPGERELRLVTPAGLSNPVRFQVGTLPETGEGEPNDPVLPFPLPEEPPLEIPMVVNGQIMPGDVDRIRFHAVPGQRVRLSVSARTLVPFMADAVPGWFQPTLRLFDPSGREVAYADDNGDSPDPVILHQAAAEGVYEVEIRDAVYRGREDFVYRLSLGSSPSETAIRTPPGNQTPQPAAETEGNDTPPKAQVVALPATLGGCVGFPGDIDLFRFEGRAGQVVVAEVSARSEHSPLDALLRLRNGAGETVAWSDDEMEKRGPLHVGLGLATQGADPRLEVPLPTDGTYWIEVSDARRHGGPDHVYRLRVSEPVPDFSLYVTPSSLTIPPGGDAVVTVHAVRKEGFSGPIDVSLKNPPKGFELRGGRIPADRDSVRMTVSAPLRPASPPLAIALEGSAMVQGQLLQREASPSDDVMQAFLYRHLVPAQALLAVVRGRVPKGRVRLATETPVCLPSGGKAELEVLAPGLVLPEGTRLQLNAPPEGIVLEAFERTPQGARFRLSAGEDAPPTGFEDNLIVEAWRPVPDGKGGEKDALLGVLPAIPFRMVGSLPDQPLLAP